nr:MAG TPA: hypothetical protein [Caudoviricetes sp.]
MFTTISYFNFYIFISYFSFLSFRPSIYCIYIFYSISFW